MDEPVFVSALETFISGQDFGGIMSLGITVLRDANSLSAKVSVSCLHCCHPSVPPVFDTIRTRTSNS